MSINIETLYKDIRENLEASRKALIQTGVLDEDSLTIRSQEHALFLIDVLEPVAAYINNVLEEFPTLEPIFDRYFGKVSELFEREAIIEVALVEDYLFPLKEQYGLYVDGEFNTELIASYPELIRAWVQDKIENHKESQGLLKEKFNLKVNDKELKCQCAQCLGDYRTQVREHVFKLQTDLIDQAEEKLHDWILVRKIGDIAGAVFNLKKELDKNFHQMRNKLKRSSVNKLENEVKHHFRVKFGTGSDLARVYKEKLKVFFNTILVEKGLKPELVSNDEYERFFLQIETGMWKGEGLLRKEFDRFVGAVLALKRKDISATILRDYLGQFWLHTEARRINRKIIYHMGPTNSGKTYHAIEALVQAKSGCYLAPLRLLASELFDTMNAKGAKTTLLTGEEVIEVPDATHFSSTIEMAKLQTRFDCCVIDEIQMLTDAQRGWAWTRALINIQADEVHICGDHSVLELVKQILALCGDTLEVREYTRKTELNVMNHQIPLTQLEKNDALIVFSRRNALKYKGDLEEVGFKVSVVYGRLSPEVRREQARKFDVGETDIMVSTDAIAMGMNLPVKRIVFSALSKFVDNKELPLTYSEIKQIAGRAGRYGRFPVGSVTTLNRVDDGLNTLRDALGYHLSQSDKAMVGPDLEIYKSVNLALESNSLPSLSLSEFLRLFNTMIFQKPFYCVDMKEMIELAELVEAADENRKLNYAEIFGFSCAPVNLGLIEHVQYYMWMLNHYVNDQLIFNEPIDATSDNIDYLETSIKCVELYQWLSRHFDNKNFSFDVDKLLDNKSKAIEKLNELLSEKIAKTCSSCGVNMPDNAKFNICEECFSAKKFVRRPRFDRSSEGRDNRGRSSRGPRSGSGSSKRSGPSSSSSSSSSSRPSSGAGFKKKSGNKNAADAFKKHR